MCGIAGVLSKNGTPPNQDAVLKMASALHRRGPDGQGMFINQSVGLVHTRLTIIDADTGQQPMVDAKGRVVVFNGEIYNYLEIRQALGHVYSFQTKSDTETILALYDVYGLDFVQHLRGMYAIALYDPATERFILTRDPFGIKPVYISESEGVLAFASEPKALIQGGYANPSFDRPVFQTILRQNYNLGHRTAYSSIVRLSPGEMLVYEKGKRVHSSVRPAVPASSPRQIGESDALLELNRILEDSVNVHCRSDVGYGVFLSGGVDSSTIVQVLRQLGQNGQAIKTYTAYFDAPNSADERIYARAVSKAVGMEYHEVPFGIDDFRTLLPQIAAYMDDPVSDYAILPTWKLAAVAAQEQKVVLCGEGGDELFAGYGRYRTRWWKDWRKKAVQPDYQDHFSSQWTKLQKKQARDIAGFLPNDLLVKLDMCLMAHGLEGRTPFLDKEVADFSFSLPDQLKFQKGAGKYLLKTWLQQRQPLAEPFRKKQGFTVPVGAWMNEDAVLLSDLLSRHSFVKEILTKDQVSQIPSLLSNAKGAAKCWSLLYLTLWYEGRNRSVTGQKICDALAG